MTRVNPAFEVSPDDPQEVAEAIARAAEGATAAPSPTSSLRRRIPSGRCAIRDTSRSAR